DVRRAKVASASTGPVTASRAPATRRAAATTSPGRSSTLDGMQPQYEHSPPTSSRSTMPTDRPCSAQRPAATPPAGPAPMTTTSKVRVAISAPPQQQVGDEAGPARLVRGAQTGAGVAVEVLVERDHVVPRRVGVELLVRAVDGPAPVGPLPEQADE